MKFRTCQPKFFYSTLDFFDCSLPFVRVNTCKANKLLRITFDNFSDIVVAQRRQTRGCFSIPCQQHTNHIQFHIVCCYLLDILQLNLGAEIPLSSLSIRTKSYLHELCRGKMDMEIDGTWHTFFPPKL